MASSVFTTPGAGGFVQIIDGKLTLVGTTPMVQLGGTTSSFPALKRNGTGLDAKFADDSAYARVTADNYIFVTSIAPSSGNVLLVNTAPTISSGFGTSPAIASSNGSMTFRVNVGTGGVATSGVIGLPTAATGWNAIVSDFTGGIATRVTASSTTSITITGASAWAASSILIVIAVAY